MKNLILNFVSRFLKLQPKIETLYTGANLDPRSDEEKATDWTHEEMLGTASADLYLTTKPSEGSFTYSREDQHLTGECGPHAATLAMGIMPRTWFVRLSKDFFYRLRSNYPGAGMYLKELGSIAKNTGSCRYNTMPTSYNDAIANRRVVTDEMIAEAAPYKMGSYLQFSDPTNIDSIASVLAAGMPVIIFIYGTYREWVRETPILLDSVTPDTATVRHFVCALPGGSYMAGGTRYITIQDSAQFGGLSIRRVSEDWLRMRCLGALYYPTLNLTPHTIAKPKHTFRQTLGLGSKSADVSHFQSVLAYEGLLPVDAITGYFGPMTLAATKAYQGKYQAEILTPIGLVDPTGTVGGATRAQLNKNYS